MFAKYSKICWVNNEKNRENVVLSAKTTLGKYGLDLLFGLNQYKEGNKYTLLNKSGISFLVARKKKSKYISTLRKSLKCLIKLMNRRKLNFISERDSKCGPNILI